MGESYFLALAPCIVCAVPFSFDPDTVPSMPIDPVTGKPPDLGGDPARATNQPICPACIKIVDPIREARGLQPFRKRRT